MAIGDIYYDKTVLVLQGDSFTDVSLKKNKVIPVGGATISTGHGSSTPTGSSIHCGTTTNTAGATNSVYINGNTIDDIGSNAFTIEMAIYIQTFNSVASTLLQWGMRDTSVTAVNSFDIQVSTEDIVHEYINGATSDFTGAGGSSNYFLQTWRYITIIKDSTGTAYYSGTTLLGKNTSKNGASCSNTTNRMLSIFASNTAGNYNYLGVDGYLGCLRITRAARPIPTSATFSTFPTYAGQISGTITESLAITSWTVTGVSASGLTCSTITTGASYTLDCPSIEPYTVTCAPTINGYWEATKAISLNTYYTPSNPETNPIIYKCTTAGITSSTEPAFTGSTYTDGSVVWTKIGALVDPISLGARIPS